MSILIRGMEMPTSCGFCRLKHADQFQGDACSVKVGLWCEFQKRPDECPLVPVPPHGRLIDADALAEHKFVCIPRVDLDGKDVGRAYRLGWNSAIEAVMENAETIIGGE